MSDVAEILTDPLPHHDDRRPFEIRVVVSKGVFPTPLRRAGSSGSRSSSVRPRRHQEPGSQATDPSDARISRFRSESHLSISAQHLRFPTPTGLRRSADIHVAAYRLELAAAHVYRPLPEADDAGRRRRPSSKVEAALGATGDVRDGFDRPGGTTPEDYAQSIVRAPILSSDGRGWKDISLHRFDVPHFSTTLGASRVHRLTLQLEGTVLIERSRDGRRDRKWSDKGMSNVVPAGVPVSRSFRGRSDFISFYLAPGVVEEVAAEAFDIHADRVQLVESFAVQDDALTRFGLVLKAEAETGGEGTCLFTDALSRALALHLLRAYSARSPRLPTAPQALVGWRLRRTIDYMQEHIAENLSLDRLAAAAGLSPSHLARSFRAATGEPPHRYLIRLRIGLARELLEHTRLPIIEVGARCGFEQTTHFATMFRKVTGMSPRAYRAAR